MDEILGDREVAPDRPSVLHRSSAELDPSAQGILDAAERLFVERGYGAVTMDELAAVGRTSKRTIYKRYRDKAGLFRAVINRLRDDVVAMLPRKPDGSREVSIELTDFSFRLLRTALDQRALILHRLVSAEAARFPDLVRDYNGQVAGWTIDTLAAYLRSLDDRWPALSSQARRVAESLFALTLGEIHRRASLGVAEAPGDRLLRAHAKRAVETILAALGPNQARS